MSLISPNPKKPSSFFYDSIRQSQNIELLDEKEESDDEDSDIGD